MIMDPMIVMRSKYESDAPSAPQPTRYMAQFQLTVQRDEVHARPHGRQTRWHPLAEPPKRNHPRAEHGGGAPPQPQGSEAVCMCSKCAQRTSERAGGGAGKGMRSAICGMGARDRSGETERESGRAREQRRQGGQGLAADKEQQGAMAVSEAKHLTDRPE
jgi:hypothetical protein